MNNKIVFLFFVFFLKCIYIINAQVPMQYYKNDINGHYYQLVNKTMNPINATNYCSEQTYNNKKGYIATFTSEEEWNWAWERSLNKAGSWISGSDVPKTGVWHWSAGSPEQYQEWYNLYFDKCYTFCLFAAVEPNLIEGEHWIHTSGSAAFPYLNNNGINAVIANILCEYGGLEEPFVPTSPTSGSTIIVSNLEGYDISTLSITFTGRNGTTSNFQATNIQKINSTHAYATIPAGQGKYYIMVSDGKGKQLEQQQIWHYELPYVGGVFPSFKKNGVATISGANFGIDASKISVVLGYYTPVSCVNIQLIKENEAFTCVLSDDLTDKFLPVTVIVSGNKFVSYKAAVYYPNNKLYYSGFISSSTFTTSMLNYSSSLRVDGQVGTIGVFDSLELFNFINNTLPIPTSNAPWLLWQNARYDPTSKSWFYLAGPKKDKPLALSSIYRSVSGSLPQTSWTTDTRFIINCTDLSIQAFTGSASTFTEFGGYPPTFPQNLTHQLSPSGGKVDIKIDNYGNVFSTIKVLFRGLELPFERDYINGELDVMIPAGFDGPYEIAVQVDNLQTPSNTQFIEYKGPQITKINRLPTTGGKITIDGTDFSNTLSNTILTFGDLVCSNLQYSIEYSQLVCDLPSGTGSKDVSIKVSSKTSSVYKYQYEIPTIVSANNIPSAGSIVSISGSNFGSNRDKIKVSIGSSYECTDIEIVSPEESITCIAPVGIPGTYNLIVTVDGLNSLPFSIYYFASDLTYVQNGVDLEINGEDLPEASLLEIKIGNVDISEYCDGGGATLSCSNLPLQLTSGDLAIKKDQDTYPTIQVILLPVIISISDNLLDTVDQSIITINGRYFEMQTYQKQNEILILNQDNQAFSSDLVNILSSESIALTINGGFGKGHSLSVSVDKRVSNKVNYSFYPPQLDSVQQNGSKIIVTGKYFSVDSKVTTLTFNSIQQELISLKPNELTFNLDGLSKNGEIFVQVDNQISNSIQLDLRPSLISVTPTVIPMEGPTTITIVGNYLNDKDSNDQDIKIQFFYQFTTEQDSPKQELNNCKILNVNQETKLYTFTCDMVSGYGYYNISATSTSSDGQQVLETNAISKLSYESPIVGLSTSLYQNEPGNVTIGASNFNIYYTKVYIGGKECTNPIEIEKNSKIQCHFSADVDIPADENSLKIVLVSANLVGSNDGFVYSLLFDCLNNCSGNGECNKKTGECNCFKGFEKKDCSVITPNITNSEDNHSGSGSGSDSSVIELPPPIITDDGETIFPGTKINFSVSITHLREINIRKESVKVLKLSSINWIDKHSKDNHYFYKGNFNNDLAVFELNITYFENEEIIEFGGEQLTMVANSIKYQVTISNWVFSSPLNILQTIYHSKTDKVSVYNCDQVISTSEVGTNQFQINTANGYLSAKFSSRMIVDDSKYIKTTITTINETDALYQDIKSTNNDYHLLTSMDSPHFNSKVILDPSFSAFFTFESKTECGSETKWKLPLIICLSVAGGCSVAIASFFVYKNKILTKKAMYSISMSNR